MLDRLRTAAALAACCLLGVGCRSVANCGDGCRRGNSLAFSKYDCSCDDACGACCSGPNYGSCESCQCAGASGNCAGGNKARWRMLDRICGCHGCGELYWSEWHNDPPMVCEPCDRCGSYIGPGEPGYFRAPYRNHDITTPRAGWEPPPPPPLEAAELEVAAQTAPADGQLAD